METFDYSKFYNLKFIPGCAIYGANFEKVTGRTLICFFVEFSGGAQNKSGRAAVKDDISAIHQFGQRFIIFTCVDFVGIVL